MGKPDHLTCLLRNLYAGQETTELDMEQRTGSKSGKEYTQAVYCHPVYLTYMQKWILTYMQKCMRNAGLDEAQAGIKNNLRYADETIFMAES